MLIWKSQAPLKVSLFVLEATQRNILTCDNLLKVENILVNRCFVVEGMSQWITFCFIADLIGLFRNLLLVAWAFPTLLLNPLRTMLCGFLYDLARKIWKSLRWYQNSSQALERFIKSLFLRKMRRFGLFLLIVADCMNTFYLGCIQSYASCVSNLLLAIY